MAACLFRARLNQLSSIWYTILSVLVQLYLLYLGLERYRLYTDMKWPHGAYPRVWLTVYVSLLAVCIPLLVLFTAFGVFKSGNLAGDNEQLGARPERTIELTRRRNDRRRGERFCFSMCHCVKSMWLHCPPLPQSIHLLLALCQLFAQQIMLAQLYRFGFINSGDFLNTELDFLYQRSRQLATNLPMGDTRLQGFRITSEELTDSPMAPNLLPILMHARLFGIPLEFVNFVVALIAYSCAYPSVFWRVSKAYSLCFSIHLIVHTITVIWSYLAFSILFRVQETNYYGVRPVGIGQHLWSLRPFFIYHPLSIIGTFILTTCLMQISPIALYNYGYNKYLTSIYNFRRSRSISTNSTTNNNISHQQQHNRSADTGIAQGQTCCDGYGPHISAIFILMFVVAAKAPTLYALTLLYQHEEKPLILSCIVIDVVYLFTWIILWLFLTLKRDWSFKVVHDVREILSLQDAHRTADGNIQNKTMTELKNSLILMHKGHLFVTDDPLAKPSIMRHVLKSCVQDDIYWLRANQSPANRKIPLEECNGVSREMGHLLDSTAANSRLRRESASSPPVPLAAPPYQRLGSLPPHGSPMHPHSPIINSFGTLQRGMGKNNEMMYGVLPPTNTTTLGRTPNQNHYNQMPPEAYATTNYATIHRNSGSSRGLATGQHYGVLGSSSNIKTASPQLMRHVRGGSVTTTREVVIGGPLVGRNVANYNTQIYAASSRDDQEKISDVNGGQSIDTQNKYNYNGSTSNYQETAPMIIARSVKASPNLENSKHRNYESANREPIYESKTNGATMMSFNESNLYGQTRRDNMQNNSSKNFMEEVSYGRLGTTKTLNSTVNGNALKPPLATQQQSAVWNSTANSINSKQIMNNGILSNHPLDEPSITPSPSIQNSTAASVSSNVTSASNHSHNDRRSNGFSTTTQGPIDSRDCENENYNKSSNSTLTKMDNKRNSSLNGFINGQPRDNTSYNNYSNNCIETYDNDQGNQWAKQNYASTTTKLTFDVSKDGLEEFATSVV